MEPTILKLQLIPHHDDAGYTVSWETRALFTDQLVGAGVIITSGAPTEDDRVGRLLDEHLVVSELARAFEPLLP